LRISLGMVACPFLLTRTVMLLHSQHPALHRNSIRYTVSVEKTFEAIYENGVLRPLDGFGLENPQHVRATISDSAV
jgi:hypothetical protein